MTATLTAPPDPRAAGGAGPARTAEPRLPAGAAVGRYVVVAPLGEGGMSTVYRAEDTALRRQVALKVLRADLSAHLAGRERFAREGQAMARLAHPHVATIHDVGQHEERVFLALELCEGGTLATWMKQPRSWREIDRVLAAAARGLAAAHAAGIVHRDFKPENVLMTRDGVPRVSDFGLAGSLDGVLPAVSGGAGLTAAGAVVGTPAYMAPEQRAGRPADERADQYSLCLVWLEALGRDRTTPAGDPGRARGPRGRIRVLMRGLAAEPAERWPDVATLLRALERRRARGRLVLAATAAGLVTAGAAGAWTWRTTPSASAIARGSRPDPVVLGARKPGDPPWRMLLAADGRTLIVSTGVDALLAEDRETGARRPLPLPPGPLAVRADAIAAASGAEVVIVRMADRSVWRTGTGVTAPVLLRQRGNGPVCLHPSGTKVAVSAIDRDQPLEIRSVDDGRVLATVPRGDLCAWAGERLVLGMRDHGTNVIRLRVLEPDGTERARLPPLPGMLGALTADERVIVVGHVVESKPHELGLVSQLAVDGGAPPIPLRWGTNVKFGPLASSAAGLFYGRVSEISATMIGDRSAPDAPIELRPLGSRQLRDEGAEWIDDDELAVAGRSGIERWRVDGGGPVGAVTTSPVATWARIAGEVLVGVREVDAQGTVTCVFRALGAGPPRTLRRVPWSAVPSIRCDGERRCVLAQRQGDIVAFAPFDPRTGTLAPPLLERPVDGTPTIALATDGRWAVESGGAIEIVDPGGASRALALPTGTSVDNLAWDRGEQALLVTGTHDDAFAVMRISLAGTVTVLARSIAGVLQDARPSPDGARLAVRMIERPFEYLLDPP